MKTLSPVEAVKAVTDTLTEIQSLIVKIPAIADMKMKVLETPGGYKFYFKFMTPNESAEDYWFTWLTTERQEKLTTYTYDTYNYIMRKLYPNDLMFTKL